jgi:hypothetical protein
VCHGLVQSSFPDHDRWGGAVAWGTTTPQPAWLARPLLRSQGMRSWHDRAAQGVVATPPAVRTHPPHAVVSGPPHLRTISPEEPGRRVSHLERDPPGRHSF